MNGTKKPLEENDIIHLTLSLLPLLNRKVVYPYKPELPESITNGQLQVLLVLSAEGPIRMQEMASALGINKQQLNARIKVLEDGGYVFRTTDTVNRKIVRADLTEKGQQLMEEIDINLVNRISTAFDCFSEEEKQDFISKLKDVKNYLMRM